jgi:hypothetical protein
LIDWNVTGNAAIRNSNPLPHAGSNYVFGAATALFTVYQSIDLLASGSSAGQIDGGNLCVSFGGFQSGYQTQGDNGVISVRFLNQNTEQIGISALPSFKSNNTWEKQAGTALIPVGTRFIVFHFLGTRTTGSHNDAYLDDAFLEVVPNLTVSINLLNGSTLSILFTGVLYESEDLEIWKPIDPQPTSPFTLSISESQHYFQARCE